jgi:hypothetical protein
MRAPGSLPSFVVASLLALAALGCSPEANDPAPVETRAEASPAEVGPPPVESPAKAHATTITAENVLEHEDAWPDIVAVTTAWTPPEAEAPLKPGYRGALIRVEAGGAVRIAFGRHGNHSIPLDHTDLIARANEVASGERHKIAPVFLAHFGTQFLHPELEGIVPYPTPALAQATRFLCVFAKPAAEDFPALAARVAALSDVASLQVLFFPLDMPQGSAETVKSTLATAEWPVPFAYPQAAEVHAQKLVGEVPSAPTALLITTEGRLIAQLPLEQPDAIDRLRAMADTP